MKRIITLISLALAMTMQVIAQDWRDELLSSNAGVIDSITSVQDTSYVSDNFRSYMIYYKQPLNHDAPEEGTISLRALFITNLMGGNFVDNMIQMSIGGYELDKSIVKSPDSWAEYSGFTKSMGELIGNFGHLLMPEHRFYGESCPKDFAQYLSHCNAKEAAADFHALAEAMKKVFHGKWLMSGVSKGGMATAIQHAYYPDDADCYVCYVAPFIDGTNDLRPQEYWLSKSWTPELREHALHIQKEILNRPTVKEYVINNVLFHFDPDEIRDQCEFLQNTVCLLDAYSHQYTDRDSIEDIFSSNKKILEERGLSDYSDEMLEYMVNNHSYALDSGFVKFEKFENLNDEDENESTTRSDSAPSDFKQDDVFSYQCVTELGYFGINWDYYYNTKAEADSVADMWNSYLPNSLCLNSSEYLRTLEYDPSVMNFVKQKITETKKPILFLYGEDDPWTGAAIDDEYVNGDNVRKFILPAQCHTASLFKILPSDSALSDEIHSFIDKALSTQASAISSISADETNSDIYDLNGRRMNGVPERGIFVQKGKKVIK